MLSNARVTGIAFRSDIYLHTSYCWICRQFSCSIDILTYVLSIHVRRVEMRPSLHCSVLTVHRAHDAFLFRKFVRFYGQEGNE